MLEKYKENHFGLSQEIHRKNIVCAKKKWYLFFIYGFFFVWNVFNWFLKTIDVFMLQKIIIQKVMRTYLYMCYQHLPEEVADTKSVYFLRNTPGMVPLPNSAEEANSELPGYFEMGILNGHSLVMLEQIISQVNYVLWILFDVQIWNEIFYEVG